MPQSTEQKLLKQYLKALKEYKLIKQGDRILLGLSGGKDSLALLHFLAKSKAFPVLDIEVFAVHIAIADMDYDINEEALNELCKKYNIPFVQKTISFSPRGKKDICFLCSWARRKQLFKMAEKLKCNKIALGHHKDDILETLLMNMMFQGSISTIPPTLSMDKFEQELIRPLCLMEEKDILQLQEEQQWPKTKKDCPYERHSKREDLKQLIRQMETITPQVKNSLWRSMSNIQNKYLPKD